MKDKKKGLINGVISIFYMVISIIYLGLSPIFDKIFGLSKTEQYFRHLMEAERLLRDALLSSVISHQCIDHCCAAVYSLFAEIPDGFGNRAGRNLLLLYEAKLKNMKSLSKDTLMAIENLAKIGEKFGSSSMYKIPIHTLSDPNLLNSLYSKASEAVSLAKKVLVKNKN